MARPRFPRALVGGSVVLGVLTSGSLVYGASYSAFSSTAVNPPNQWSAGTVALTEDSGAGVLFNLTGVRPPTTGSKCITVTYNGNVAAQVKVYASSTSGGLLPYLYLTVEQGTGGSYASCTGFSGTTLWGPNTANNLTATTWATGLGTWSPNGSGQTRTYRFSWSLVDDEKAESTTANLTFAWEAQGT
jgi:hypothetical protein